MGRLGSGIAVAAVLLSMLATPTYRLAQRLWQPHLPPKKHLAILPFKIDSRSGDEQAFSRGLTETLTARLAQLSDRYPLQVVSASDTRGVAIESVSQAHAEYGANLVLEGSLRQAGNRVRVVYRLVDATTDGVLRADSVTADVSDPFALEDRVVESAIRSLDVELAGEQQSGAASHGTTAPAAYDFYLRGRGYLQDYHQPENIDSAVSVFQRALHVDPDFALAYAGLGESYWRKYEFTHDASWIEKALENCRHARDRGQGYVCLGTIYNGTGKPGAAVSEFAQALQLDIHDQDALRGLAFAYERLGRTGDAEQTYRRAIELRPEYWGGYNWLGAFLYGQQRYKEAAEMFVRVTELAPDNVRGYNNLCGVYIAMGEYGAATPVCQRSVSIRPTQDAYSNLGNSYFYQHRFGDAAAAYEKAVRLDERMASAWGNLADAYYWQPAKREQSVPAYRKAISLGEEQLAVNPRDALVLSYVGLHHAMVSEQSAAWSSAQRALALAPDDADVRLNLALLACKTGDHAKAIAWLQKAVQSGVSIDLVRNHPMFDALHSNASFQRLLTRESHNVAARN